MTCNPRSTSIAFGLRYGGISTRPGKSSIFAKTGVCGTNRQPKNKTHRSGKPGRCAWGSHFLFLLAAGLFNARRLGRKISEPIQDLVGPEPLEPVQRLVQRRELLVRDAADLLHGLDVLLIERVDDAADFLALRGETDTDRAAIDARALMVEEAEFN